MRFKRSYFLLALLLLGTEVVIARYAHDRLIRPYGGDLLATVLVYCLIRSVFRGPPVAAAVGALLVSYAVEAAQYGHLLAHLGGPHAGLVRLVLGSSFSWADVLAYTLGASLAAGIERARAGRGGRKIE